MRITLCVGCDRYDYASPLNGAEHDAARTYELLIDDQYGAYDRGRSRLVRSPTVAELKEVLGQLLYSGEAIDVFTFQFAGHGIVSFETLYLALRDTDPSKLPITGFSFSELVRAVVAAKPNQANFIIDACNSGGLGYDLPTILRGSVVGTSESTGVSFLAAAAADEFAWEDASGGAFTSELLRAISGQIVLQTNRPFLDLSEIGSVLEPQAPLHETQTVSRWALNVQGPGRFVRNPHFVSTTSVSVERTFTVGLAKKVSDRDVAAIRRLSLELREEVDESKLAFLLKRLSSDLEPNDAAALIVGLFDGMGAEARLSSDPFAEARVYSVFLGQIARLAATSEVARDQLPSLIQKTVSAEKSAIFILRDAYEANKFCLLGSGLTDLFFLPIRIADVMGRVGSLIISEHLSDAEKAEVKVFLERILETYGNSILSLSEDQAPGYFILLAACAKEKWIDIAEEVIGRLYTDLVDNFGRVSRNSLEPEKIIAFLKERYKRGSESGSDLYQSPSDLATVIIFYGSFFGLDEALDYSFLLLDHMPMNIHFPDELSRFGEIGPIPGANLTVVMGQGFWRCIDFRREWTGIIAPKLQAATDAYNSDVLFGLANASLSLKDRVPWFSAIMPEIELPASFCRVVLDDGTILYGGSSTSIS